MSDFAKRAAAERAREAAREAIYILGVGHENDIRHFIECAINDCTADDKKVIEELNQRYDRLVDDHDALDAEADTLKMQRDSLTDQLAQCRAELNAAKEEG